MISSATRHIYLVRHGQYEIGETELQKRILTGMYLEMWDGMFIVCIISFLNRRK